MSSDPVEFALKTPGHLKFPSNLALAHSFEREKGRVDTLPTGHLVFYRSDGRRFLATDPTGYPLHECEWELSTGGTVSLARARFRLDWDRWVGVRPGGLVNETRLNLSTRPGWQSISPDDLRVMAAQALRVTPEEVRWFYCDDDLRIDVNGIATIRHRKDAFYALEAEGFDRARFMSCMGAMHWDHIDFLPVVELFKSLLPGTGSAAFELIRGLYDDQNRSQAAPRLLRYRGIPTYPSESAFRLFSNFFVPHAPGGTDPLALFLDQPHSHEVAWLPRADPPVRYFDQLPGICLTLQGNHVLKATVADDDTGLPFVTPGGRRVVLLDRWLRVADNQLVLTDREQQTVMPLRPGLLLAPTPDYPVQVSPIDWRTVFALGVPPIRSADAYGAVLFYPENEQEISELSAQPFVADYLQDLAEQDQEMLRILSKADQVLIDNGDAVISTCIPFDRPRDYTVKSHHAAYAQRQAQQLWTQCAEGKRWEWLRQVRILPAAMWEKTITSHQAYDLVYQWLPYELFNAPVGLAASVANLQRVLRPGGHAFVVGPQNLRDSLGSSELQVCWDEPVEMLPTFRMHKAILPKARLKPGLVVCHVTRS